ncbi:MAG: IscS subfamily cysteine desulfurase [Desulfobacterales bacterium]|jgi:cysteine desulfurase|nr:IscS subfamily cysteine desulfurase [Desulfobacterales bacterium]MDH4010617.1 IscS subfamily cysteine desulfurase [Desulfobacterales bacterium]
MEKPIYLDYNATTPHDPEVIAAMRPFFEEEFGNPSSSHFYGSKPKQAVIKAREQIASLINCRPEEMIFTSGGTESNNFAIKGIAQSLRHKGNHIITTQIEHPAVLEVCNFLQTTGFEITYLAVDEFGLVSAADVAAAIKKETILISVMHANNEVGTVAPITEITQLAKKHDIAFHTDAAQSVGKIPVDVNQLGVDLLSIAGHKVYAPKGVGALYIRQGLAPTKLMHGAGQEMAVRAGTENVLEIVGLGTACEIAKRDLEKNLKHMQAMRDRLHEGIKKGCDQIKLNGHPQKRLPNTLSISFLGLEANRILDAIGSEVAVSAGAACHSDTVQISDVLTAMNVPLDWAKGTLRLTTGRMTTAADIDKAVQVICAAVEKFRTEV